MNAQTRPVFSQMAIVRNGQELSIRIQGDYYAGAGRAWERLDPENPPEVSDITAEDQQGRVYELSETEEERARQILFKVAQ
jgi:hypothetical protein